MEEGQNRVLIGLPERLEKAKAVVFALEKELDRANELILFTKLVLAQRKANVDDETIVDALISMYEEASDG